MRTLRSAIFSARTTCRASIGMKCTHITSSAYICVCLVEFVYVAKTCLSHRRWAGEKGYVDVSAVKRHFKELYPPNDDKVKLCVCGPPPMIDALLGSGMLHVVCTIAAAPTHLFFKAQVLRTNNTAWAHLRLQGGSRKTRGRAGGLRLRSFSGVQILN